MKRNLKWGLIALVVLVIGFGVLRALSARKAEQASGAATPKAQAVLELAPGDLVAAQAVELSQGLPISGSLKAANTALVKARVAGELRGLLVREGDAVKAGQVIAQVDPTEYQARVRQAQEQADAAKSQIDTAKRQWDNNKALVDQGFISKTALDTSWNTFAAADANHKAAVAAVDLARKALDDTMVRAPISGLVSQRLAQPGERVAVEARIVEIVDLSQLELEATLGGADSLGVRVGQVATLTVEGATQPVTARVTRINPSAQAGSRGVVAYLSIDKPAGLRQGLFAQGVLGTGQVQALSVPLNAVRTDKPLPYVQVVQANAVAHATVKTGARGEAAGEAWVAVEGVSAGTPVIRGHVGSLREGTRVRTGAASPAATPASAPASASR